MRSAVACLLLAASLAACAAPQRGPSYSRGQVERALANTAGAAQPSRIVSAEIAFARAAREDGQWTAFREFAAPGAIIHGASGASDANAWLAGRQDPPQAVAWRPRAIWMSCDGALAISEGRYRDPDGTVGTFVTLWQRQSDGEYRWLYDAGTPDDPQPPPPPPEERLSDDAITVTAIDAVQGLVADCSRGDATADAQQATAGNDAAGWTSPDGTLAFRWRQAAGQRHLSAQWLYEGRWQTALEHSWPVAR
ncbi:hypothetical protein [Qipengyuania sp.]|uniref:hypothetical protein n=1 Tax=Qipengyuania sp. TaxID=2004515 RepID=UPI0035C87111